eukprot:2502871-Amphidinium_carterae.1
MDTQKFCHISEEGEGIDSHLLLDCLAFAFQYKEPFVQSHRDDIPACEQGYGLGIVFPVQLPT